MAVTKTVATRPTVGGRPSASPATASLKPSDQQQGGLLDDVDVTLTSLSFVEWDYDGKIDHPVLAILAAMTDEEGAETNQYYSAGDLKRFQPSEDGKEAIAVGGSRGLNSNTNAGLFLRSIVDQGFPEDKITSRVDCFEGMNVHVNRVAQPKRSGLAVKKTQDQFELTVLLVTKINRLPWEKAGKSGGATSKSPSSVRPTNVALPAATPGPTVAASPSDTDLLDEAGSILLEVLASNGNSIPKSRIAMKTFKALAGNPNRSAILQLLANDEFLNQDNVPWAFDGTTITAA
jgi:hypothetical protein